MAVQQNKKSRSKRDMRRSHDFLIEPTLSRDKVTGATHIRHHMTPDGFYRGRDILGNATPYESDEEDSE